MGTEMVMVDEIPFPPQITTTKPLSLLGHGITDIEIHFLQIKFTAIGVYLEPEVVTHLQKWKGKPGNVLAEDDGFFEALINAPVDKFLRVVVIKEIKGSQYGVQLESAVRDRLAAVDKYEEEEEEALEKVVEFFQSKYFKKNSIITYHFPANSCTAEIAFNTEGKEDVKIKVENANVVEMIKKWYLGGSRGVSPNTITSLANALSAQLGTETVTVDEIAFPGQIRTTKPLSLLGHGITDIEIHFLQIKFTAIGVYLEPEVVAHLQQWKGKPGNVLAEDDDFFEALINAPVEKLLRVVVIKEIKGSQYGVQLESAVRDRLAADDKYEEEEEEALEKVVEFFQSKYFKKNSIITYHFPANSSTAEIAFNTEGKEDAKIKVENANVVEMMKKWYLGGTRGVSATTITSLANALSAQLCQ